MGFSACNQCPTFLMVDTIEFGSAFLISEISSTRAPQAVSATIEPHDQDSKEEKDDDVPPAPSTSSPRVLLTVVMKLFEIKKFLKSSMLFWEDCSKFDPVKLLKGIKLILHFNSDNIFASFFA